MRRLGIVALVAVIAAGVVASSAQAALFFLFKPAAAATGDVVTVRLGGTPPGFTLQKRVRPFKKPIRLYLVAAGEAEEIRSRSDPRLSFIGQIVPDKNARGLLSFRVPPLDTDDYVVAYWCPGCAPYSSGRTFGLQTVPQVSRYRHLMGIRVQMSDPTDSCPVTIPDGRSTGPFNYGNGMLSSTLPSNGVVASRSEPDGSLFWKPGWRPGELTGSPLTVRGERLDAPSPPMRVLTVRWGSGGSWATAATFPSEGCWRISGRVADISLSYVVKVVAG